MHAMAIDEPAAGRIQRTRRIDVTDIEAAQVLEYAATREGLHFERRGGWTYLIEER